MLLGVTGGGIVSWVLYVALLSSCLLYEVTLPCSFVCFMTLQLLFSLSLGAELLQQLGLGLCVVAVGRVPDCLLSATHPIFWLSY